MDLHYLHQQRPGGLLWITITKGQTMKTLMTWLRSHPLTAVLFATAFTCIATSLGFREDWAPTLVPLYGWLVLVLALVILMDTRKLTILLLILSLALPTKAQEKPEDSQGGEGGAGCAAVGVAVVVVVVGGYFIYKLVKFCQKKFPKSPATNDPPAELTFYLSGTGGGAIDSASFNYSDIGSCFQELCWEGGGAGAGGAGGMVVIHPSTTTTLVLQVAHSEEPGVAKVTPISVKVVTGPQTSISWEEFRREVAKHGVQVTGKAGEFFYAHNGEPIPGSLSPISWDPQRRLVRVAQGGQAYYTIVVERSSNLSQWIELLRTEVEVGSVIQVEDTEPTNQHFYRYHGFLSD